MTPVALPWIRTSIGIILLVDILQCAAVNTEVCSDFIPCVVEDLKLQDTNTPPQCRNVHSQEGMSQAKNIPGVFPDRASENSDLLPTMYHLRWPSEVSTGTHLYDIDFLTISEKNGTYSVEAIRILNEVPSSGVLTLPDWFWPSVAGLACIQGVFRISKADKDRSDDTYRIGDLKSLVQYLNRCPVSVQLFGAAGQRDGKQQININLSVSTKRDDRPDLPDASMHLDVRTRDGPVVVHIEGSEERVNLKLNAETDKHHFQFPVKCDKEQESQGDQHPGIHHWNQEDATDVPLDDDHGEDLDDIVMDTIHDDEDMAHGRHKRSIFDDEDELEDNGLLDSSQGEPAAAWFNWFSNSDESDPTDKYKREYLGKKQGSAWAGLRWIPTWLKGERAQHDGLLNVEELMHHVKEARVVLTNHMTYISANGGAMRPAAESFQRHKPDPSAEGSFLHWAFGWIKTLKKTSAASSLPPRFRRYKKQVEQAEDSYFTTAYEVIFGKTVDSVKEQTIDENAAPKADIKDDSITVESSMWYNWIYSGQKTSDNSIHDASKDDDGSDKARKEEEEAVNESVKESEKLIVELKSKQDVLSQQSELPTKRPIAPTTESDKKTWVYQVMMGIRHAYDFILQTTRQCRVSVSRAWRGFAKDQCVSWYRGELVNPPAYHEVDLPPCSMKTALEDPRFVPDTNCNTGRGYCPFFHNGAYHCIRSIKPSHSGHGQQACYSQEGKLLNYTSGGGTFDRSHPDGIIETDWSLFPPRLRLLVVWRLSHLREDVWPYLTCCKFTEYCNFYGKVRPTWTSCKDYKPNWKGV